MNNRIKLVVIGLLILITFSFSVASVLAAENHQEQPVVRAVLFYSPTCGHCSLVINETLPPLIDKYGDQLQIIGINVATQEGAQIYQSLLEAWKIAENRYGVPTLVVGSTHLVGSAEIPEQFPGIIEDGLLAGGIDWPDIPGLAGILAQVEQEQGSAPIDHGNPTAEIATQDATTTITDSPTSTERSSDDETSLSTDNLSVPFDHEITMWDRFQLDLAGNILAVVVLLGMVVTVVLVLVSVLRANPTPGKDWSWAIPILSILGLFVAGYLSFVEVTGTEAVCGPVGDCNSVQQSPYAILFGFLPVGVLGLLGYIGILGAWFLKVRGPQVWRDTFTLAIWGMAFFGVIFSIYLTYLEPFVIGATCAWCISSAIIITLQFVAATEPVRLIWSEPDDDDLADEISPPSA
jgi:uncharacterized membrane protein